MKDFWKAKYVVISESIRSLAILANRMHVQEEQLVEYFESNADVLCVLPSWAELFLKKDWTPGCICSNKDLAFGQTTCQIGRAAAPYVAAML